MARLSGWIVTFFALAFAPGSGWSNPRDGEVTHGEIRMESLGDNLQIIQDSSQAIIEWQSFSVGTGERTEFVQPGSTAAVLNRVLGGRSDINGLLKANGRVFLINPNGVVIGPGGRVDAGAFIASTLDISDADFLAGGDHVFQGGSGSAIVNLGTISASDGDAILIAAQVRNTGQLLAPNGLAGIAAGTDVLLQQSGDERLFVRAGAGEIVNETTGVVEGRGAELKAGSNIYGIAIQQHGRVAANGAVNEGGQVFLRANGGKIVNTSRVEATRPGGGSQVTVDAGEVQLELTSELHANQVRVQTDGGQIAQLGSITALSEGVAPGVVEIAAGAGGDVALGPESVTTGETVAVSSIGGEIRSDGRVLAVSGPGSNGSVSIDAGLGGSVQLSLDSELAGGTVSVKAAGGSILSAGHVVGRDGGDVSFDASPNGEIVIPLGSLIEGGSVGLKAAGGTIDHAGTILARDIDGQGGSVNMDVSPGGALTVQPSGLIRGGQIALLANGGGSIDHAGTIVAENAVGGGSVTLQADGGGSILIQPTGYIEGGTVDVLAAGGTITHQGVIKGRDGDGNGGAVTLDAGAGGSVEVFGQIDATGDSGVGGAVTVTGETVAIRAGALIDASGRDGGGVINIGGGFGGKDSRIRNAKNTTVEAGAVLRADATNDGPGGNIVVWADGHTNFAGTISARGAGSGIGGNAEVSGKRTLSFGGQVDLGAENGVGGSLLLDPGDFTIDGAAANTIQTALVSGTNVNVTTDAAAAGNGDVFVDAPILAKGVSNPLGVFSILAHRHILVNERIQLIGDGGAVNLIAGWDGATGFMPVPASGLSTGGNVPDMQQFPNTPGSFGNEMGSVFIGHDTIASPVWVGTQNGPTTILGFNLDITASANTDGHAGVGYVGGVATPSTGEIAVDVLNSVSMTSGAGGMGERVRIGHEIGGAVDLTGKIFVNARDGDITLNSGSAASAFAAIGHSAPAGTISDVPIEVFARKGTIDATSGGAPVDFGHSAVGVTGDISLEAANTLEAANIVLDATLGAVAIGHMGTTSSSGTIRLRASGELDLIDGVSAGERWEFGHDNLVAGMASPIAIGVGGLDFGLASSSTVLPVNAEVFNRIILPNIGGGAITLASTGSTTGAMGGLIVDSAVPLNYLSDNALNLLSTRDVAIDQAISNTATGAGDVNVVAGWDGQTGASDAMAMGPPTAPFTFDPSMLSNDPTAFGQRLDRLDVNADISAFGTVNLFGGVIGIAGNLASGINEDPTTVIQTGHRAGGSVKVSGIIDHGIVIGNSTNDTLIGPDRPINYLIDTDNGGSFAENATSASDPLYPTLRFSGIENLTGGSMDDAFLFTSQASLQGVVDGGGGFNTLFIDDNDLTTNETYRVFSNRISRNPEYAFQNIQQIGIQAGEGNDTIQTRFYGFGQNFGGGLGIDNLGVILTAADGRPGPGSPLVSEDATRVLGNISFTNFDNLIFTRSSADGPVTTVVRNRQQLPGADGGGFTPRERPLAEIVDPTVLAQIAQVVQEQTQEVNTQIQDQTGNADDDPDNTPNPQVGAGNQNQETEEVTNETGPTEMSGGTTRMSPNLPADVAQRFNEMFNAADWAGTGLNVN